MPKATFFRLEEEKQQKIIDAAITEFSSVPIDQSSIANIVKLAGIPRGSFYQYFEDKDDVFYYICDNLRKEPEELFMSLFHDNQGDIFKTFREFFDYFIHLTLSGKYAKLMKNIFIHMDYKRTNELFNDNEETKSLKQHKDSHQKARRRQQAYIIEHLDYSKLKMINKSESLVLIRLLFLTLFASVNDVYRSEKKGIKIDVDVIKSEFNLKLDWLLYGVAK